MDELRYVHFWVLVVSSEKLEAKVTLFLFLFLQQFLILSIKANCEWSIDKVNTWNKVNHIFSSCLSFYQQFILYYCQQQQSVLELRRNFESKIFEVFQVLSCFIFPAATHRFNTLKFPQKPSQFWRHYCIEFLKRVLKGWILYYLHQYCDRVMVGGFWLEIFCES